MTKVKTFIILLAAAGAVLYATATSSRVGRELVLTNERLSQKQNELFAELDSKLERLEKQIVTLKEQGYVEAEEFPAQAKKILETTVLVANSKEISRLSPAGEVIIVKEQDLGGGAGTGFFISADGLIVTAKHVVDTIGAENLVVRLISSGKQYEAHVVAKDDKSDVAVVKAKGQNFPFVEIGYSENLEVGEEIGFIGFAPSVGLARPMVHNGVISAQGTDQKGAKVFTINAFVNKGNSGGPVFSAKTGRVLGMLSARQRDVSSEQFYQLPANYSSGFSLGGVDPLKLSVDLYNQTLKVVGDVSQVGIGVVYSLDAVRSLTTGQ